MKEPLRGVRDCLGGELACGGQVGNDLASGVSELGVEKEFDGGEMLKLKALPA